MAKHNGGSEIQYNAEGEVQELKNMSEFEGAMSSAQGKVVAMMYHNSCPGPEQDYNKWKQMYQNVRIYKVNTINAEDIKSKHADGSSKPFFKFYRNGLMISELKYQNSWDNQIPKIKDFLLKYNDGPPAEIKLAPYHPGAKVDTLQSIKQFEDALKNAGDTIVLVAFVNDQGHCKDAENAMDRLKGAYKEIYFYKVNTKHSEDVKNKFADGNSKPYFKFYRNSQVDSDVKYTQNWGDNEPALTAKLELYKLVGDNDDSPDAILKDISFQVFKKMSEYSKFTRTEDLEEHLGDRIVRPTVKITYGEFKGTKYQGEWAEDDQGLIQLHGWGILSGSDGSWIIQGYFKDGKPHGKSRMISAESYFEGYMLDGMRHGEGFVKTKKRRFDGAWKYDMREGKGIEKIEGYKCCNDPRCKDNIPEM